MAKYSNLSLELILNKYLPDEEKFKDNVAKKLMDNIKEQANEKFGHGASGYPYDFKNSFQSDKPRENGKPTIYYEKNASQVRVNHPAVFALEYGISKAQVIIKKDGLMKFTGKDGETIYTNKVTISPKSPTNFIHQAINNTIKDIKNKNKELFE